MKGRRYIVRGQRIESAVADRARELRRDMTPEEAILWNALRTNRLGGYHFRRQQVIDRFIVDFYCHSAGLVEELDGDIHQQQVNYDIERDRVIPARGLEVLRIPNDCINSNLPGVLKTILIKCKERTLNPT